MHTHPQFRLLALLYKAMANERRLFIVQQLMRKELTNRDLLILLRIHSGAVSKHLHLLLRAGIIEGRRKGREVFFRIRPSVRAAVIFTFRELLMVRQDS